MPKANPFFHPVHHSLRRIGNSFSNLKNIDHGLPSTRTLLVSLVSFVLCLLVGTVAAAQKQPPNIQIIVSSILVALVFFLCFLDSLNGRRLNSRGVAPVYARNLGNTVTTAIVTLIAIPLLYTYSWYPALNQDVITTTKDTVDHVYYPSITLLQHPDAPHCVVNDPQRRPCRCEDRWEQSIDEFHWQNTTYRTLTLVSSEALICTIPTTLMLAQAFLWYDSSKAMNDSSRVLSPSLSIAVYDPTLSLREALENDYTRPILVNANGMVAVNLGLNYRQVRGRAPAYDYDISLSTIPSLDLLCNVGSDTEPAIEPCFLSLWLQFPTFERQVSTQGYAMSWTDVVASAGSWLSLFQIISWILSGLALQR